MVSVVIVTYNKADTISAAIKSVLSQTFRDLEILIVDDGSTDTTAERVKIFDTKVRYLPKRNGGTGSARNLGIAEAQGEFVAFLDGDDLWLPQKLEIQMEAFKRESHLIAVQCEAYCVDPALRMIERRFCTPKHDTLLDFLLFRNLPAFASCVMIRKETLKSVGGFGTDLVILSDWDMCCRLARAGTIRSIPEPLVLYRQYPNNQSRNVEIHLWSGVRSLRRFFADPALEPRIRLRQRQVWARFYAMLAGGYIRNRKWGKALGWTCKALRTSPAVVPYIAGFPIRRLRRVFSYQQGRSFLTEFPYALQNAAAKTTP